MDTIIHVKMTTELSDRVNQIFARVGLKPDEAIRIFYKQVEINNGLPFDIILPITRVAEDELFEELKVGEQSVASAKPLTVEESQVRMAKILKRLGLSQEQEEG